jgi:hypothetical protein
LRDAGPGTRAWSFARGIVAALPHAEHRAPGQDRFLVIKPAVVFAQKILKPFSNTVAAILALFSSNLVSRTIAPSGYALKILKERRKNTTADETPPVHLAFWTAFPAGACR